MSRLLRNGVLVCLIVMIILALCSSGTAHAQPVQVPQFELRFGGGEDDPESLVGFLQLLLIMALLTLAPAFVVLMTSFTRIVVVLSFARNAMATQQIPPNQILIGLALFLTYFVMQPTFARVNETAIQPYLEGEITQEEAFALGEAPLREFMFYHTREKDLALFVDIAGMQAPETRDDIPLHVLVPSFVISELKTAFQMGFMLFVPFLIIDMVIASTLMSMGMFMLPPVIVSMPFKILLFILVDGWHLLVKSLLESFI
ncbi:MAG: flagellar type III secretion system pore protein FliP [Bacillota bacterium]